MNEMKTLNGYKIVDAEARKKIDSLVDSGILPYNAYRTIHVGGNLFNANALSLGSGWSNSNGTLTHASGGTAPITFSFAGADGEDYLLEFKTSYTAGEFVKIAIGNGYPELAYSGTSEIVMPLHCWGNPTLTITPYAPTGSTVTFTMSDIKFRKIQETGDEVNLFTRSMFTDQNLQNYGYRNIILGHDTFQNATGSTRTIAIGAETLNALKGGHRNIAIGGHVFKLMDGGESNIGIGADCGIYTKKGDRNIAIGVSALHSGANVCDNVAIGQQALGGTAESTASGNVAIGKNAMYRTYGSNNVGIGLEAGGNNKGGYENVMIGNYCSVTGEDSYKNTFIGGQISGAANIHHSIALGYGASPTKTQQMVLGGTSIIEVILAGNKKLNFNSDGTVTWTQV